MKNLIKITAALFMLALVVVGPKAAFADDASYYMDSFYSGDYYDSYADYSGDYYDSYSNYSGDYYDSYSDYSGDYYDSYSGYSGDYYDSYADYSGDYYDSYDTTGYYETAYDYGGYETAYDYGSSYGGGYGGSYMPYGDSSCIGPCGSGGRGGLGLNLSYSNSERNTSIKDSYNTNIKNDNDYTSIVTNTRTENTCSNGTNCNTVYNQVAQANPTNTLSGTCPTSGTYSIGQTVNWTASATGGTGSYSYSWSGDVSGSGQSVNQTYFSNGTKNATVTITSGNQSITRSCSVLVQGNNNYNNLTATCPTGGTYNVGQQVTWSANAYGGNGNYTYYWSGAVNGYGNYLTASYSYPGTQYATVRVTDGSGNTVTQSCQVTIGGYYGGTTYTPPTTGVLTSGVLLSSIPYTGLAENMKMAAFVLGMILWSAFVAWVIMRKKLGKKTGTTQADMIAEFKRQNLARKQATA